MYDRIFNFSAGPSMLPVPVLEKARDEMLNCQGSGMSVNEMSHRSKVFDQIAKDAEALVREVLAEENIDTFVELLKIALR